MIATTILLEEREGWKKEEGMGGKERGRMDTPGKWKRWSREKWRNEWEDDVVTDHRDKDERLFEDVDAVP